MLYLPFHLAASCSPAGLELLRLRLQALLQNEDTAVDVAVAD